MTERERDLNDAFQTLAAHADKIRVIEVTLMGDPTEDRAGLVERVRLVESVQDSHAAELLTLSKHDKARIRADAAEEASDKSDTRWRRIVIGLLVIILLSDGVPGLINGVRTVLSGQ